MLWLALLMIFLKVEYEGKAFLVWYCCKWSKWNRCWQVSQFLFFFYFSYLPFSMLSDNKVIKISFSCRFDYIVRDSRACGLGCNFQFERYLLVSSRGLNLIVSYMLWWTLHSSNTKLVRYWQIYKSLNLAYFKLCKYFPLLKRDFKRTMFPIKFSGWWNLCELWMMRYATVLRIVSIC